MDLQFSCYISPVCDNGVDSDAEMVGNFLVGHSLHEADYDIFFSVAEHLTLGRVVAEHVGDFDRDIVLFELFFEELDGRHEDMVFDLSV